MLDSVLSPLLHLPPVGAIFLVSFVLSLVIVLVYKYATDQVRMKSLKDSIKQHQVSSKEHREDPQKALEFQKKAMEANLELMKQSLKPTLITMLPIIILFSWLSAHYALVPIAPNAEFLVQLDVNGTGSVMLDVPTGVIAGQNESVVVNNTALFSLQAPEGEYLLRFTYQNSTYEHPVLVASYQNYASPLTLSSSGGVRRITTLQEPLYLLNIFGWNLGWIWTYVLFSVGFSIGLRRLFKVH